MLSLGKLHHPARVSCFLEKPLTNAYTEFYILTTIIKFYDLLEREAICHTMSS